jgi:hypothetical protein
MPAITSSPSAEVAGNTGTTPSEKTPTATLGPGRQAVLMPAVQSPQLAAAAGNVTITPEEITPAATVGPAHQPASAMQPIQLQVPIFNPSMQGGPSTDQNTDSSTQPVSHALPVVPSPPGWPTMNMEEVNLLFASVDAERRRAVRRIEMTFPDAFPHLKRHKSSEL